MSSRHTRSRLMPSVISLGLATATLGSVAATPASAAAELVVNSTADDSECSAARCTLRGAISAANQAGAGSVIRFKPEWTAQQRITVVQPLPALTSGLVIDGGPDVNGLPRVVLAWGGSNGVRANGLRLTGASTTVRGLAVTGFTGFGISVEPTAGSFTLQGNFVGTADGATAAGNVDDGIHVARATGGVIGGPAAGEGNLVSGNRNDGIELSSVDGTIVVGNVMGTDRTGRLRLPNADSGVEINAASTRVEVGRPVSGGGNLISGNDGIGVQLLGSMQADGSCRAPTQVLLRNNLLGPSVDGSRLNPHGNFGEGVQLSVCARDNVIGGTTASERNVISGNRADGVELDGSGGPRGATGVSGNVVAGNLIGTDPAGRRPLPNVDDGVGIDNGAVGNTVGGGPGARNVISSNYNDGVDIARAGTRANVVRGNVIGLNADGAAVLPNGQHGVLVRDKATDSVIESNTVSGNVLDGIRVTGVGTDGNAIRQDLVGTDLAGSKPLGNSGQGVAVLDGPRSTSVIDNTIAGNKANGVLVRANTSASTGPATIRHNAMWGNVAMGIDLQPTVGRDPRDGLAGDASKGNGGIDAPAVTDVRPGGVAGDAPPGSTVDVYLHATDTADQGRAWLGSAVADAKGTFCWSGTVSAPVVAAATDAQGNTSEMSLPAAATGQDSPCGTTTGPIFVDTFSQPDGSAPVNWATNRSAADPASGALVRSGHLEITAALTAEQLGNWQYVQSRLKTTAVDWSSGDRAVEWSMSTTADNTQANSVVLSPTIAAGNAVTSGSCLRVMVRNSTLSVLAYQSGSSTVLWQGKIAQTMSPVGFRLLLSGGTFQLEQRTAVGWEVQAPQTSTALPMRSAQLYVHTSTAGTRHTTSFDDVVIR